MDELSVRRAKKLLLSGLEAVSYGDFEDARDKFKSSAGEHLTADALTYWGWMEYHLGNPSVAVELCEQAIEVDPDFGNPYNDIGSYLVAQEKYDDAVPWLEKAIAAVRYEPRQFPHINLSKIYVAKGMPLKAIQELEKALNFAPNDAGILDMMDRLQQSLN